MLWILGALWGCEDTEPDKVPEAEEPGPEEEGPPGEVPDEDADGDGFSAAEDCDDLDAQVHPGAQEVLDGEDNDCDPATCLEGFAADPITWDLPPGYGSSGLSPPFIGPVNSVNCDEERPGMITLDMTGDGVSDLVVHGMPCLEGDVGRTRWLLYEGGPGGFAPDPTDWALPPGYGESTPFPLFGPDSQKDCEWDIPGHSTMDLTGDTVPDMVITALPCGEGDVGYSRWLVYEGGTGGFATEPTDWALPAGYGTDATSPPLGYVWTRDSCEEDRPESFTLDATGDGWPDLLILASPCGGDDLGYDHWLMYEGGPGGFAPDPTDWALPPGYGEGAETAPFYGLWVSAYCEVDRPSAFAMDVLGDGMLDLVLGEEPCGDGELGHTHWLVYEGGVGGFVSEPVEWALPSAYVGSDFAVFGSADGAPDCELGIPLYLALDLTGDGALDLVISQLPCGQEGVGSERWLVYEGSPAGFADEARPWPLPGGYPGMPFPATHVYEPCDEGVSAHTGDLDGDRLLELVVTSRSCDPGDAGYTGWLVYERECRQ
jgi:hypothetical protein